MEKITLSDGLTISRIGLGCMSLPDSLTEGRKILESAIEAKITFWDTADLYQKGWNEEMIGKILPSVRSQVALASKGGNEWNADGKSWSWNPRKEYLIRALEKSLQRLKTDYIDLYQLHGGTLEDPWEEVFEAFELMKSQGKIRAFGISSIRPNVVRKVLSMSSPATIMSQYSPLDRRPEEDIFPQVERTNTRILVRGALAKGLLIDKASQAYLGYSLQEVDQIKSRILETGFSPLAVLLRFGLEENAVASLVLGASKPSQIAQFALAFEEQKKIPSEVIHLLKAKYSANRYVEHR
jgi:aryl-alcohol dehydrogenase-like predicted oxidoreductase